MAKFRRREIIEAVQFDPDVTPWPKGVEKSIVRNGGYTFWIGCDGHGIRRGYWLAYDKGRPLWAYEPQAFEWMYEPLILNSEAA